MGKADKGKGPDNLFSGEQVAQGWEPWTSKRSRVSSGLRVRSGLRSFERLTREGKAGLYVKQDAKRKVRTPLHGGRGWVKTEGLNAQYRDSIGPVPKRSGSAQRRGERSMECEVQQAKRCRYLQPVL